MHPKHHRGSPVGLRVDAEVTDDGQAHFALHAINEDGNERRVASWSEPVPDLDEPITELGPDYPLGDLLPDLEIARSPSGDRAAVRVGRHARTFELSSGDTVHVDHGSPEPDGADHDVADALFAGSLLLAWNRDETASVRGPFHGHELRAVLAPDVEVAVHGPVDHAPREASSYQSWGQVLVAPATPDAQRERALTDLREQVSRAIDTDLRFGITVTRDGVRTVVQDDTITWRRGAERPVWPVFLGPRGLLIRRTRVRAQVEPPQERGAGHEASATASGYVRTDTEVLHPWLVARDGTVRVLPFELGNLPLATLTDGRFLLPCGEAMWWDGGDEPLAALADDGTAEPLSLHDRPMTPTAIVRAVAPGFLPDENPDDDEFRGDDFDGWRCTSARLHDDRLTLALEPEGPTPGRPWWLVELAIDGLRCEPLRLIATGPTPPDGLTRIIV